MAIIKRDAYTTVLYCPITGKRHLVTVYDEDENSYTVRRINYDNADIEQPLEKLSKPQWRPDMPEPLKKAEPTKRDVNDDTTGTAIGGWTPYGNAGGSGGCSGGSSGGSGQGGTPYDPMTGHYDTDDDP